MPQLPLATHQPTDKAAAAAAGKTFVGPGEKLFWLFVTWDAAVSQLSATCRPSKLITKDAQCRPIVSWLAQKLKGGPANRAISQATGAL